MSTTNNLIEEPPFEINANYSLEEDLPSEVIGKAMVIQDGEPLEVDVSSTDPMGEESVNFIAQYVQSLDELRRTEHRPSMLGAVYSTMELSRDFYFAVGGTLPVRIGASDEETLAARDTLITKHGMSEEDANVIVQDILGRHVPEEPPEALFFGTHKANETKGPATTTQTLKDMLLPIYLALDEFHDKEWATKVKLEFAQGLTKLAYFTPAEGEEIVEEGPNMTPSSPWTDKTSADATNFIFSVHGGDGMKQLGGFIRGVLDDSDFAGVPNDLVALKCAEKFQNVPSVMRFFYLKALNPNASGEMDKGATYIRRVVDAFTAAMQWDQYQEILDRLNHNDRVLKNHMTRYLPAGYASTDMREATKVFLAGMARQSLKSFKADLKVARSYHEIRATSPYMMFMIGPSNHRNIKLIGPDGIRSVVRHFASVRPEYSYVMNVLQSFEEKVVEFCNQDMSNSEWDPQPIRLPYGVTDTVNTSMIKIDNQENTIQRCMTAILDQLKPEPGSIEHK